MKKKLLLFFLCMTGLVMIARYTSIEVNAEETEPITEEVIEQEPVEEEVTISVKLNEFLNKWLTPAVSGALGLLGSLFMYFLTKKRHAILLAKLTDGVKLTEKAREVVNNDLELAKKDYENAKSKLDEEVENYKNLMVAIKNDLQELKDAKNNLETFKQLIAMLVASVPELARNGYATKILELLDETTNENVGD